ncbi:MAG: DUF1211 domain-containing protein [Candidatus Aegiribacteria sp.]|nr:DUF1211 domain-containing protein [Candidatus Aegiribacteria sp.]
MTIMVLALPLPEAQHNISSDGDLLNHLLEYSELFWTYVLSFLLLGYFWINQQKLFKYVNNTCTHHLWANLGELLLVCVIPFSSGLVGDHINYFTASFIFHMNVLLIGVFFLFQCMLLLRYPDILKKDVSRTAAMRIVKINLIVPSLAVAGIVIACFSPQWSLAVYILVPILSSIVIRRTKNPVQSE